MPKHSIEKDIETQVSHDKTCEKLQNLETSVNANQARLREKEAEISSLRKQHKEAIEQLKNNAIAAFENKNIEWLTKYSQLQNEYLKINNDINTTKEKNIAGCQAMSYSTPIEIFNSWASSPFESLPQSLFYLNGDMKIRMTQALETTTSESKWICNINDKKKYLFPNPNFFDQMTDINELYIMNIGLLKEKEKNKIKIIEPCEIYDSGFINLPGKLELL